MDDEFSGAHAALFLGNDLLVILRDDFADIPSPDCWDFPGGTRDGDETPAQTLIREVHEEVALTLSPGDLSYAKRYVSHNQPDFWNWFYVVHLPAEAVAQVRLGDEGQCWKLMSPAMFLAQPNVVPSFLPRLIEYLDARGGHLSGV